MAIDYSLFPLAKPRKGVKLGERDWDALRLLKYEKQDGICAWCNKHVEFEQFHLHHPPRESATSRSGKSSGRGQGGGKRTDVGVIGICGGFPESCHSKEHGQ